MKKKIFLTGLAVLLAALTLTAGAAGFARTNTYTDGKFADVPASEWYNSYVKDAYELGFMKGSSDTQFNPQGNMTVAEAITIVSRVNDTYSAKGTTFDQSSGNNWYDCYVNYAVANGIITADQFDDYTRKITRAEMAVVFSKAVPADFLPAKNNVTEIPDVPSTNAYFDELKLLYNAGVVMGSDDFGTFKPNNNITRAEASAIIGRIALPETRQAKTLVDANYGDAYYLIYDGSGKFNTGDLGSSTTSAWHIDNRNSNTGSAGTGLSDQNENGYVAAWRDIDNVTEGLLGVEFIASVQYCKEGTSYNVTDDNKNPLFTLETKGGKYYFNGADTGIEVADETIYVKVKADLDDLTAKLYMNGKKIGGDHKINDVTASRVYIESTKEAMSIIRPSRFDVYKDYVVNDLFLDPENAPLLQWEVTGGEGKTVTTGGQTYNDFNSAEIKAGTVAKNSFKKISGDVVFEAYMLLPEDADAGYISLNNGDASVAKLIVNNDGVFTANGTKLRFHNNNIWQTLRIEADTVNQTVTYKVNGKKVGEYPLDTYTQTVDNITVGSTGGTIYFDDVTVHLTHDYDDYTPVPVPVTDDGYDVILNVCSLWREGTHSGWGCESAYPDIEPALGYYDEGLVEVADWEIKFMVENGIDIQHFCWYCPSGDIKEPMKRTNLNFALHDGFFNAKYSDMMKFTFMWENNGTNCHSLEQFKEFIWPYWIDYYFLDDRYYTIDNKIVFTVWNASNFKTAFGGTYEGAQAAVKFMNEDIKQYGFDGVMIFFADGHQTSASAFENFANLGGTGAYAYHWQQDGNNAASSIKRLDGNQAHGKIHVVPTVSVGFNNLGWSGVRKPMASVEGHRTVLEHIKNNYLTKLDGWKSKTLIVSTWNEYGEGTYVMPAAGHVGFGYLENVAEVISGDTEHKNNIYPTEQQKARLGHLYPDSKTSLERLDLVQPTTDESSYKALYSISGEALVDGQRIDESRIEDGIYYATTTKSDPIVAINSEYAFEPIDTDLIEAIRLVVKVDKTEYTELFFTTVESPNPSQEKCFGFSTNATGDFVEYIIPTNKAKTFTGTLKSFRLDIVSGAGSFAVKEFELLGIDESKLPINININANKYEPTFAPEVDNGEVYVTAEPDKGFFKNHNFYYEWSRFTGKLYISTANDKNIIFTVGSDVAIVNGEEKQLAKKLETIDGLPNLPLFFMYDALGIRYEYDKEAKKVDSFIILTENDEEFIRIIKSRVPYEYEFNLTGDNEKFTTGNCTITVADGFLKGTATKKDNGSYDPIVSVGGLEINTEKYNNIIIGMKHRLPEGTDKNMLQVFFTTDTDGTASETKSFRKEIKGNKADEVVEYSINCTENSFWTGTIKSLRIDPVTGAGEFDIDYIRVQYDEEIEKAQKQAYYDWLAQGFSIRNGDAEDTNDNDAFFNLATSSTVSIVKDADTGSHVWENKAIAQYSYTRQNVIFEPGKKYEITVDVKLLGTKSGITEGVKTKFHCNVRYSGNKDHVVFGTDVAVADGWKTLTFSFSIPEDITPDPADEFCFYTNPFNKEGVSYRFDNIKVKKAE